MAKKGPNFITYSEHYIQVFSFNNILETILDFDWLKRNAFLTRCRKRLFSAEKDRNCLEELSSARWFLRFKRIARNVEKAVV